MLDGGLSILDTADDDAVQRLANLWKVNSRTKYESEGVQGGPLRIYLD